MKNNNSLVQVLEINAKLEEIFKSVTHGFPYKLFRKKIIEEISKTDYYERLESLLSQMSNGDLLLVMNIADYVDKIIYVPKYLSEAFIDFKKIKEDPDYLIKAYNSTMEQHKAIANMSKDENYYEMIKEKSKIEKIEKYLLESMTNEQIYELANSSKDWQEKLYLYRFLKDGEKPCKFKKQKEDKYYVIKVKYISEKDNNEYYYICNYEHIKRGDRVIVTSYTGHSYDLKVGKVIDSNYYLEKDLPIKIEESEEVLAKTNEIEELGGKYSFGQLKFYDNNGKKVPFFDADLDRQCYLSSLKIADEITDRLSDDVKEDLSNIPSFELVPDNFKKMIINEFLVYEPEHIRKIEGAEDEISDYILFNIKHPELYLKVKEITQNVLDELDENEFENLLSDTFEENNIEFIKYIENNYVRGSHKLDYEDNWIAKNVFNKLIIELQKINRFKIEQEKFANSLLKYSFRDINRKIVLLEDTREMFDNYGIKKLENPFLGYVYLDIDRGLNVRIIGNENNQKLIEKLCTEECFIVRHDLLLNYKATLYDKKINTFELDKQMDTYYSYDNIEKVRARDEIDHLRSKEYPDDVTMIVPFKNDNEQLWVRLVDYDEKENLYIAYLLNDSYKDRDLVEGTFVACKYTKISEEESVLIIHSILKKPDK